MTETDGKAQEVARTYITAMANKDVDTIVSISAADIACSSPVGKLTGIEGFRGFQDGFARMIKNLTVLAVYGDDDQAVVVYDVETYPVPRSIVAEYIKVKDGKLVSTEVIYDSEPFVEYMKTARPH